MDTAECRSSGKPVPPGVIVNRMAHSMFMINRVMVTSVCLIVTCLVYLGAYAAMMSAAIEESSLLQKGGKTWKYVKWSPEYRYGGQSIQWLFLPIHQLDKAARPNFWLKVYELDSTSE
jgi:hypothetical protein